MKADILNFTGLTEKEFYNEYKEDLITVAKINKEYIPKKFTIQFSIIRVKVI